MIDALGHPITEGCKVLTPGYWSPVMSTVAKVKKVTKTQVHIEIFCRKYKWDPVKKQSIREEGLFTLRRQPHQVLVVDKQLAYNRRKYPENLV